MQSTILILELCFWNLGLSHKSYAHSCSYKQISVWLFVSTVSWLSYFHTFRCLCFPFLGPYNNHKLDFRSSPYVFLGYISSHLGYRCIDIASQHIYISRHVWFHEHVFPFDNSEQIAKVSSTPPTQTAITVLLSLLHSLLFPTNTTLSPQSARQPQQPPLSYPSSYACLSNHSALGTACKSVFPTFPHELSTGVETTSGSSSASPNLAWSRVLCVARVQATSDSFFAASLISVASSLLAAESPSAPSASLNLMVDFSSYPLQQNIPCSPSSPASPPLLSQHPMVLRPRQLKIAKLVGSTATVTTSPRVLHYPSFEPLSFSVVDRYAIWHDAMHDEIKAFHSNHTWSLVP